MKKEVLSRNDWDFDNVPDNELVACCYWEYARESAFVLDLKQRLDSWDRNDHCPPELSKGLNRIQQAPVVAYLHLDAMLEFKEFPGPWRKLSKQHRQCLVKLDPGLPEAFARGGDVTEAELLLQEARNYCQRFTATTEKVRQANPNYGESTLRFLGKWPKYRPKSSVVWEDGYETAILRIGWEGRTNEQIVAAFCQWVKKNRPRRFPAPSGKGHKQISHRVALERLGILRLLHRFRFVDLAKQNPAAWKRYDSDNRRWRKDAQKAVAEFYRHFPFLKDEHPLSRPSKD